AAHRADGLVEHLALGRIESELDHALDALRADHHRYADVQVLHAVWAVEIGRAGEHALLVLEIALRHRDRRGGRRIEGRAGLEQGDDLAAALARAVHDRVEALLRGPLH